LTGILGISAFYHDSAVALMVDGKIVAAAQEERFTRKKQNQSFPAHEIEYCLQEAGLDPQQLDFVGSYDKPLLNFLRLLETYLAYAPVFCGFTTSGGWPRHPRFAAIWRVDDLYQQCSSPILLCVLLIRMHS